MELSIAYLHAELEPEQYRWLGMIEVMLTN